MRMIEEESTELVNVISSDLKKHKEEAIIFDVELLKNELLLAMIHLREWCRPHEV